jgi:hypothetical protein
LNARSTPIIGLPKASTNPMDSINVSSSEVESYLKRKRIPMTKTASRNARRLLKRKKYLNSLPKSKEITLSQSDAPWVVGYGQFRIGGALTFVNEAGAKKNFFYAVATLFCHEIDSVQTLFCDGNQVSFPAHGTNYLVNANGGTKPDGSPINYTNKIYMEVNLGSESQSALSFFVSEIPTFWTSNHRQRGCAHVGLKFTYDAELFPNERPETIFEVRGKKVYDPRSNTTIYTSNAALIIADYITNTKFGLGEHFNYTDHIDLDSLSAAADICDEAVDLVGGGTEYRYTIDGYFETDQDHDTILSDLESAMAGHVELSAEGKWKFWPGVYRDPTITLTEEDLRGEPEIEVLAPEAEIFNSVRGSFCSRAKGYEVTDYPPLSLSAYVAADNGKVIWGNIDLPYTVSAAASQRIARFALERSRRQLRIKADWGLRALQLEVGDTATIQLPRYGINAVFEVQEWDMFQGSDSAVIISMDIQATDTGVDLWNPGTDEQEISIAPVTTLPDMSKVEIPVITTVESGTEHLYHRLDGTIFSRIYIEWEELNDIYVTQGGQIEIQIKRSDEETWQYAALVSGDATFAYILDVQDGVSYDIGLKAINGLGIKSDFIAEYGHVVQGKTEKPSDVTGFVGEITDDGILLSWDQISDLDRYGYEIRRGVSWVAGAVVGTPKADGVTSFVYHYYTAGSITLWIKAIDTSGNYSTNAISITITITAPNPAQQFVADTFRQNVLLDWKEPLAGSLTVNQYDVYKGDTFATAIKIGTVFGTFHTYIEKYGGEFTYWIVAIDVGGNQSTPVSASTIVTAPKDFYIQDDRFLFSDLESLLYAVSEFENIYAPYGRPGASLPLLFNTVPTYDTWQSHFTVNGFESMQDAIDAGYTMYLTPNTVVTSRIVFEYDYGVTFGSSFIDFSWIEQILAGAVTVIPTIETSPDETTWTTYENTKQVFASDFRYVKYILEVANSDVNSVSKFSQFRAKLSLEYDEEEHLIIADEDDVDGTLIEFENDYLDVTSIVATCNSINPANPVYDYDFSAIPAQDFTRVKVFDEDGNRITVETTVRIRGAVNP